MNPPKVTNQVHIKGQDFLTFWQSWPYRTKFGEVLWNVTNLTTGKGYGGFVESPEKAQQAITAALEDEEAGTSGSDYAEIPF